MERNTVSRGHRVSQVKGFERVDVARSSRFFSLDIFFEKVSRSSENSRFGEPFLFLFLFYLSDRSYRKLRSYGMCENMEDYDF